MGRSPDYKAAFLGTLGANAEFYEPYQDEREALVQVQPGARAVHQPRDHSSAGRPRQAAERGRPTSAATSRRRPTPASIVSGAKVVATGSVLTNYTFVAHHGLIPVQDKKFAVVFMVPTNAPGVKFICRTSYEMTATVMGSPFDYPLSSRLDENDAVFIMDNVLVPWENVFVYGDIEKANNFFPRTGFLPRFVVHGCTRLAVKLDFIAGLLLKAVEAAGTKDYRGVQANVGEVIAWRNLFWALSDAMVRDPKPWIGDYVLPNMDPGNAYQIIATMAYTKIKYLIEQTVASGLIYLNSHASDFKNPEIRPYLDRYMRGSQRLQGRGAGQADEAAVGLHRHRVRRPPRALRDQLRRLDRGDPPLLPVRRAWPPAMPTGSRASPSSAWPSTTSTAGRCRTSPIPGELSYHVMRGAGR